MTDGVLSHHAQHLTDGGRELADPRRAGAGPRSLAMLAVATSRR